MTVAARETVLALLNARSPEATVCPSEVARAIASGKGWRETMPDIHAAVDRLLEEGMVQLSWKGRPLAKRSGPYRIRRNSGPSI